jgi:hypothetical protein
MGAAAGRLKNIWHRVWRARIDRDVGARGSGERKLVRGDIKCRDVQPHRLGVLDGNVSEASDARDGDPFARPCLGFLKAFKLSRRHKGSAQSAQNRHRPEAARQKAPQRSHIQRNRHHSHSRCYAGARTRSPDRSRNIRSACRHRAATQRRRVAWLEIRDARAKRSYNACNLMAWNEGKRRLHRPIAFSGMQVGMADAAGHHLDQDLSRTRHRHGYVLYHQRLAELVHYGSLQDIAISQHALDLVRSKGKLPARYGNFIGGNWVAPADGQYFTDYSPINGERLIDVAKSTARDVEMALDAAHKAKDDWTRMAPAERSRLLNKVADRMEENLELLALAETLDNGKPIRETRGADVPLAIDHFRYFAGCIPAETGAISTIDNDAIAHHFREPLGVVGQIIPWNFPLLMAAWKIAPALAAGNCTVIKPASNTPLTLLILAGLTADILPPACST